MDISQEFLTRMKTRLNKEALKFNPANYNQGSCWSINPEGRISKRWAACHSWITDAFVHQRYVRDRYNWSSCESLHEDSCFVALDAHPVKHINCSEEAHRELMRWVAFDSFAKDWILNKDDEKSLYEDGIILLCGPGEGASLVEAMWLCKFMRYEYEGNNAIETWYQLVKRGVDPYVAVAVCSHLAQRYDENSSNLVRKRRVTNHVDVCYDDRSYTWSGLVYKTRVKRADATYNLFNHNSGFDFKGKIQKAFWTSQAGTGTEVLEDGWGGAFLPKDPNMEGIIDLDLLAPQINAIVEEGLRNG